MESAVAAQIGLFSVDCPESGNTGGAVCKMINEILRIRVPLAALCGYYSRLFSGRKGPKLTSKWKILTCVNEK